MACRYLILSLVKDMCQVICYCVNVHVCGRLSQEYVPL